ncbi:MAG: CAP domain-containing protein [Sporolactobacillus sp.]
MRIFKRVLFVGLLVTLSFATLSVCQAFQQNGKATAAAHQTVKHAYRAAEKKSVNNQTIKSKFVSSSSTVAASSISAAPASSSTAPVSSPVKPPASQAPPASKATASALSKAPAASSSSQPVQHQPPAAPVTQNATAQYNTAVASQIVSQINVIRTQNGLCALQPSNSLTAAAQQWSMQQYNNGAMGHGMVPGGYGGQNVAYANGNVSYFGWDAIWSASATVSDWMNSAEHKANILNPNYRYTGVGVVYGVRNGDGNGWVFYTQNFSN